MQDGGEILRTLRVSKGLSLKELAEKVDVNYVFLSKLERSLESPSEDLIKRIANELEYDGDINELVTRFGRVPEEIKKLIIEDPASVVELPRFFKSRRKVRK